ncbi:hypothetical protein OYC64_016236 [Pagothenia borchgrevinki]|uniref:Uncharacterized protein n=1 Tax=Pagothenia borchgrevinki TaxID=8213 RepID=A0ABD2HJT7_PAGBO
MKLLLLLAVAASQMELSASQRGTLYAPGGNIDIGDVTITFYGKTYTWLHVKMGNKNEVCLKNDPSEDDIDCVVTSDGVASDKVVYSIIKRSVTPFPSLVNIKTKGLGYIYIQFYTGATQIMDWVFYNHRLQAAFHTSHALQFPAILVSMT